MVGTHYNSVSFLEHFRSVWEFSVLCLNGGGFSTTRVVFFFVLGATRVMITAKYKISVSGIVAFSFIFMRRRRAFRHFKGKHHMFFRSPLSRSWSAYGTTSMIGVISGIAVRTTYYTHKRPAPCAWATTFSGCITTFPPPQMHSTLLYSAVCSVVYSVRAARSSHATVSPRR